MMRGRGLGFPGRRSGDLGVVYMEVWLWLFWGEGVGWVCCV
jgi:hypothetical protein